jgi:putative transposase
MCETLQVSKSGYYDWVDWPVCARQQANATLAEQIQAVFSASDESYGMPRVRAQLHDEGIKASRKRAARLKRQNHWHGVSCWRSFCVTPPSATSASAQPLIW